MNRGTFVPDDGPLDAAVVVIGEAPGRYEVELKRPFVGPSGYRLDRWMREVGLERSRVYVTNVYPYRPPIGDNIESVPANELREWIENLHERLAALHNPRVLVPLGNTALYALIGKVRAPWERRRGGEWKPGITNLRGSIYPYLDQRGRTLKVIPTIHPAAALREPAYQRPIKQDWRRITDEAQREGFAIPQREALSNPTLSDCWAFVEEARQHAEFLAIDIERPPKRVETRTKTGKVKAAWSFRDAMIACVGFAYRADFALVIPTTLQYWSHPDDLEEAWRAVQALCTLDGCDKVLQNGGFDTYHLRWERGIDVTHYYWDLLGMHSVLDSTDWHTLEYMTSIDTQEPYYKDEAKDPEALARFATSGEALRAYCAKDACVQRELFDVYYQRLQERNQLAFYENHYAPLYRELLEVMLHGWCVDRQAQADHVTSIDATLLSAYATLEAVCGAPMHAKKGLSGKRLQTYFYEKLRLPKKWRTRKARNGERTVSVDEAAIRELLWKHPEAKPAAEIVLQCRQLSGRRAFYNPERVDPDGRFRSFYGVNTETGRLNSSENPRGTGSNGQNIPKEVRPVFLADEGCVLVDVDLSQVEARDVYLAIYSLTGNKAMLEKARARPDEYDQHTAAASLIFGVPETAITPAQRYMGKRTVHAAMRGMAEKTFTAKLMEDDYYYTPQEGRALLDAWLNGTPGIFDWFAWTRELMLRDRRLTSDWGRRLSFEWCFRVGSQFSQDDYRRGYSFRPQANCADHMNQRGFLPFSVACRRGEFGPGVAVNGLIHDALVFSAPPKQAYDALAALVAALEQPYMYYGVAHVIPCTMSVGVRWGKPAHEWKRLPSRQDFEEIACALYE